MLRPDYSARDKAVKHNVYASVRRRDGVSHERFASYWRDVHSTLCSRLPVWDSTYNSISIAKGAPIYGR